MALQACPIPDTVNKLNLHDKLVQSQEDTCDNRQDVTDALPQPPPVGAIFHQEFL